MRRDVLTIGSLFSGIGGFDLGFERAGMRTVWFCEQDAFCQRVLAKHWPGVPVYPNVRALTARSWCECGERSFADCRGGPGVCSLVADAEYGGRGSLGGRGLGAGVESRGEGPRHASTAQDGGSASVSVPVPYVDVLCGGFPCQDISIAGRGEGIDGQRSGLWAEYARLIRELRPRYVVVENVAALLHRGLDRVLGDLAACGYDAEWDCIPASAVGAPHRRDRVWLVAYPSGDGFRVGERGSIGDERASRAGVVDACQLGSDQTDGCERSGRTAHGSGDAARNRPLNVAYPARDLFPERQDTGAVGQRVGARGERGGAAVADTDGPARNGTRSAGEALLGSGEVERLGRRGSGLGNPWESEPDVGRVAHGVPARVDRLRALGNALVPQIAEWIGRRILEYEEQAMKAAV
jgi:DNA (cytosine-5)-methyltransferase 1